MSFLCEFIWKRIFKCASNLAAASGEPMKSHFTYKEMESLLEEVGLLIYEHLSPEDIQSQFFNDRNDYLKAFETVHYIHAVKK